MVIKVYISSVTCNNLQRKNQHAILSKLQAEKVDFEKIDITDPKHNEEKLLMRENSKSRKEGVFPLPPQVFNDSEYCGDYETFADALETQNLWEFLKLDYGLKRDEFIKDLDNMPKELQDQMKQKLDDDDFIIGFKKEGEAEEEKKDEEGGEKTKEEATEEEKVVEEAKEGEEEEKKEEVEEKKEEVKEEEKKEVDEEKEEDTKEAEAEVEKKEEAEEESEPKTEVEEKVEEEIEEKKPEESETQE